MTTNASPEETFPPSCKPFALHGESIALPIGIPRIIMLHNLSESDIWITHQASESETDSSPDLSSRLQSNRWSALALDQHALTLHCIESKPGHEQGISCEQALAVCEWHTLSRPQHKQAIFWAAENMTLPPLIAYIGRLGFELPQTTQSMLN
jgi:hypothetical protein